MPTSSNQRAKLLYLMRILLDNTDEGHPMSMSEIIRELAEYGIQAEISGRLNSHNTALIPSCIKSASNKSSSKSARKCICSLIIIKKYWKYCANCDSITMRCADYFCDGSFEHVGRLVLLFLRYEWGGRKWNLQFRNLMELNSKTHLALKI